MWSSTASIPKILHLIFYGVLLFFPPISLAHCLNLSKSHWSSTTTKASASRVRHSPSTVANLNKRFKGSWNKGRRSFSKQQFFSVQRSEKELARIPRKEHWERLCDPVAAHIMSEVLELKFHTSPFSIPSFTHTSFAFPTPGHQRIPAWAPVQEDYPQGPRAGLPFSCKISWFGVWQEIMQEIWQEIQ